MRAIHSSEARRLQQERGKKAIPIQGDVICEMLTEHIGDASTRHGEALDQGNSHQDGDEGTDGEAELCNLVTICVRRVR